MRAEFEAQDLEVRGVLQETAEAQVGSLDRCVGRLLLVETDGFPLGAVPHWFFEGPTHSRHLVELYRLQESENSQLKVEIQLLKIDDIAFMGVE